MLILTNPGTADKLEIILGGAVTVDTMASYADKDTTTGAVTEGNEPHSRSTAATFDLCAGPGSGKNRNVREVTIRNTSASTSVDVTTQLNVGGTVYQIIKITLAAGDTLEYVEGVGWFKVTNPVSVPAPNVSVADQVIGASVTTYLTDSDLHVSAGRPLLAGTTMRWWVSLAKSGAATASMTYDLRVGTAGTTGDTSRANVATGTQTAVADTGVLEVMCTVRSIGASGTIDTWMRLTHNLATTGLLPIASVATQTTSATFDTTATNLIFGLSLTTGASHSITHGIVLSEFVAGTI